MNKPISAHIQANVSAEEAEILRGRFITTEEYEKMPLKEKFRAVRENRYPDAHQRTIVHLSGPFCFWVTAVSCAWLMPVYVLPALNPDTVTSSRLYFWQVVFVFCAFQGMAQWFAMWAFSSVWKEEEYVKHLDTSSLKAVLSAPQGHLQRMNQTGVMLEFEPHPRTGLQWRYCTRCQHCAPPRCHHCPMCDKCVLKRDHHCYFTGNCVGYYNQRNFLCFLFYSTVVGLWTLLDEFRYMLLLMFGASWGAVQSDTMLKWSDLVWPVGLLQWLFGMGELPELRAAMLGTQFATLPWGLVICGTYLLGQIWAIFLDFGRTPSEWHRGTMVRVPTLSSWAVVREILGPYWAANFIFPLAPLVLPCMGDPVLWPGLRQQRGRPAFSQQHQQKHEDIPITFSSVMRDTQPSGNSIINREVITNLNTQNKFD